MTEAFKLLAVFPHPDDETLGLGSTLARYSAEGVETYLVCATRGERGWFDSEGPNPGLEGVGRIREGELRCATEHLGLQEVSFLEYIDGDVDQAEPMEIIAKITKHIRRIRPPRAHALARRDQFLGIDRRRARAIREDGVDAAHEGRSIRNAAGPHAPSHTEE